ncbi:MAG: MBOAT family protein [Lachnospiraceae bacterium]|nr:MBOAT family protein [Lachnospiraceae bacterium]
MIFSSLFFIFVFLVVVLAVYYALEPLPIIFRNIWLFLASLFFYAWGEPKFCLVMLGSIGLNYIWGLLVDRFRDSKGIKALLAVAVASNLIVLFIVKYLNFTVSIVHSVFGEIFTIPQILLPIGVSFYTFQAISYVIDVYRKDGEVQKNPLNVGLYIAFFPQLVAGPIVRYDTVAKQLTGRKETVADFATGIERFLVGFCKKILIANTLAVVADASFESARMGFDLGADFAWLGALAYSFQIFFDFSAYSDMAIGLGKMFGFHFNENFNYPYVANSVADFWRRWHISLGSWFRDYVYIPMGGSRVKMGRLVWNTFAVWMLTGIWHGANWTFILWGFMYFVLIAFEKVTGLPKKLKSAWAKGIYRVGTLLAVLFGWIIFRSATPGTVIRYVKAMFGLGQGGLHDDRVILYLSENWLFWIAAILLSIPMYAGIKAWVAKHPKLESVWAVIKPFALVGLALITVSYLVINAYNPFIYFNF